VARLELTRAEHLSPEEILGPHGFEEIVGNSDALRRC
jgi:hypothetical protein